MLHLIFKLFIVIVIVQFFTVTSFTQETGTAVTSTPVQKIRAEKKQILAELDKARLNHDMQKKEQLEAELNKMDNTVPVVSPSDASIHCVIVNKEVENEFDYNYSTIANISHYSHGVATVPSGSLAGRIFVAVGVYAPTPNPDTAKIYYSTNNGVSWVLYSYWFMPGMNMDFRANEMDIITAYDGTTAWLFGVTSINQIANNTVHTIFWRYNLSTNDFYRTTLYWPGAPVTNMDYNGRIASDDAINAQGAYVYISVSSDSAFGSGYHVNRTKFALVQTPFVITPAIIYRNFGFVNSGNNPSSYVYNDVAYIRPGLSRVFNLMNFSYSIFSDVIELVWSDDYGATTSGHVQLSAYGTRGVSMASVVADGYPRMMIVNKKFSSANYNIEYYYTSTGGTTSGSWTQGFIENTSYRASGYPNVTWVRGSLTDFKAAFTLDSGSMVRPYYAGWNGSAWNSPSRMAVGNLQADSTYACPVAGYKLGGGDNCLTIWSNYYLINASYGCLTTVGNNNNQNSIPESFYLHQNYPNPFNPVTSIKYDIPEAGFVNLIVYDITGKEIESLIHEDKAAGKYKVTWDGSKYSSGVYFFKIEINGFSDFKKMVLIK